MKREQANLNNNIKSELLNITETMNNLNIPVRGSVPIQVRPSNRENSRGLPEVVDDEVSDSPITWYAYRWFLNYKIILVYFLGEMKKREMD